MNIGDKVKWHSQANATKRIKVGIVVGIVPAGEQPRMGKLDFSVVPTERHRRNFGLRTLPRNRESYIVSVKEGVTDKAKRVLYRPIHVELADETDEEGIWRWWGD